MFIVVIFSVGVTFGPDLPETAGAGASLLCEAGVKAVSTHHSFSGRSQT